MIALAVGGFFLLNGDDDGGSDTASASGDTGSAEGAVGSFIEAVQDVDCDGVTELTTEDFHSKYQTDQCDADNFEAQGMSATMLKDAEYNVADVEEDGEEASATVELSMEMSGESMTVPIDVTLVQEGDEWLVDDFQPNMSEADIPSFDPEDMPSVDPDDVPSFDDEDFS